MPVYLFTSIEDESVQTDIYFPFKDAPRIGAIIDHEGQKWRRMPTYMQMASNTEISPFDSKAFVEKTGRMKGTYGELTDYSKEMSEKRAAASGGVDVILEKHEAKQEALTGLKSFRKKKEIAKESLAKKGVILE